MGEIPAPGWRIASLHVPQIHAMLFRDKADIAPRDKPRTKTDVFQENKDMFLDTKQETDFTKLLAAPLHAKSCTPHHQKEGSGRSLAEGPQHHLVLVPHQPSHRTASEPAILKASRILPESFAQR